MEEDKKIVEEQDLEKANGGFKSHRYPTHRVSDRGEFFSIEDEVKGRPLKK